MRIWWCVVIYFIQNWNYFFVFYSDTESNLRDLPKKGQEKVLKSDVQLKEGAYDLSKFPLNDSPKLAKNIEAKSTKIGRHNKHA